MSVTCVLEACYCATPDHEESRRGRERGLRMVGVVTTFQSVWKYSSILASIAKPAEG